MGWARSRMRTAVRNLDPEEFEVQWNLYWAAWDAFVAAYYETNNDCRFVLNSQGW